MGEEITTIDISNAEELSASSFTNVKNSIDIKIDNSGDLTDANDNAVTMLNFGDRGDHCVTVINAELPSNFSEGYLAYFLVDLKNKTYIQKCLMEGNIAKALITKEISLDTQSVECLFALIEANATIGNLREQQEIFVSDVFMGTVRSNFLDSNWMDADISVSEDLTVLDKFETPNPDKYTSMVWVNGETKLNAANMNNIIKGIDELKEQAVEANPIENATELLSKIKINDKVLASGKTYQYDDIVTNGTLKDGIFNEILQLTAMGCSNITILQSDLLFTFVGLSAAMKNGSMVVGLVFHSNMVVYPTDTEKHSMCVELILFQDNSISDGGTFNLPEPPVFSDNVQDKKYTLELRKSDSLSEFVPQWTEKSARTLIKNGTYHSKNGDIVFNTVSFTDEEIAQINNKEIDAISGNLILEAGENNVSQTDYFVRFDGSRFMSYRYDIDDFNTYVDYTICGLVVMEGNQAILMQSKFKTAFVPPIPAENNKILVTNNGQLVYEDKPNKSNSTLKKDGTFKSQNGPIIINSINFTDEELKRINNREIDSIYGSFDAHGSKTEYRVFFSDFFGDPSFESYKVDIDSAALDDHRRVTYTIFTITILEGSWVIVRTENDAAYVPSAPSTQNKILVTDNGYLKYVDMPNHVIANPADAATASLKTVKIGKTTYNITSSSSSGGSSGSGGDCNSVLFMKSDIINNVTNNTLIDGAFQELMDTFGAHKIPIIYDNNDGFYIFSGIAMGADGDQMKIGFSFTNQLNAKEFSSQKYAAINAIMILWEDNSISHESSFSGIPTPPEDANTKSYILGISSFDGSMVPAWVEKTDAASGYLTADQFASKYADASSAVGMNIRQVRDDVVNGKLLSRAAGDGGLELFSDLYQESKGLGFSMLHVEEGYMEQTCAYVKSTPEELNNAKKKYLFVPDLPSDASSTNYMLSSENGVLTWTKIEDKISSAINNAITSTLEANY